MEPDIYKVNNHIESIIENNYGGTIVFDLTQKFDYDTTAYLRVCQYIESLLKRYKIECLFVFTYNMDNTGFSYYLLPKLNRYVIPVMLREGNGERRAATNYLKALIEQSEYAKYAQQASEFLKQYPGDNFTQTDILKAYEQFEAWCLNKNVLQAYDYNLSEDFMLDRNKNTESSYDKLHNMIGLNSVKRQIDDIIATNVVEKQRKNHQKSKYQTGTMHMVFGGNPGTAKTTVVRLFAEIMKDEKVLSSGKFVEVGRADLVGNVVGSTAPLVKKKFREAQGEFSLLTKHILFVMPMKVVMGMKRLIPLFRKWQTIGIMLSLFLQVIQLK